MKRATKWSITLPPSEFRLVTALRARLGLESNIEVVRRGLRMLQEVTDRDALKEAYRRASTATRAVKMAALMGGRRAAPQRGNTTSNPR